MEQIIPVVVENGIPVASFIALIYFIFYDKKQSNTILDKILSTLDTMEKNMVITNERLSNLEKNIKKEDR